MVNKNKVFIFVIGMVTITVTKVVKKTGKQRTNLTFLGMARRKIHFKTKREANKYYNSLDPYTQQQMRVYKRSPKHFVVCNDLEWLHFYGG